MMDAKMIFKQQGIFAILAAAAASVVRLIVYQLAYTFFNVDLGLDFQFNLFSAFAVLHFFEVSVILSLLGH